MPDGPDRILPTGSYTTCKRDGCAKIRFVEEIPGNREPKSLITFFKDKCTLGGSHVAMSVSRDGQQVQWTYSQYYKDVCTVAKAFIKLGLQPFHGVGIWGFNSPEWFLADVGAIFAGGLAVGIYPTNNMSINKFILEDSQSNIVVVEDQKNVEKILSVKNELPHLKKIVQYSGNTVQHPDVLSWKDLMTIGEKETPESMSKRHKDLAINQCSTLVYTSGTTGMPKGVMLSHDNIYWCTMNAHDYTNMREFKEIFVSYLPLSHIAANLLDIWVAISGYATIYFADKMALKGTLINTLREARPTVILGVPRVWEKIMEGMLEKGKSIKGLKRKIADSCKKATLDHHLNGTSSLMYHVGTKVLFKQVRAALGLDRCYMYFSGAAPISLDTMKYFLSLDISILELYGLSETTGPQTMAFYGDRYKLGTVGRTIPGLKSRLIDKDATGEGEICMWGRNVMMGYLNRDEIMGEVMDSEDWLKSGDKGIFDDEGFLRITGRIKELIITAGGENIAPVPLEDAVKKELPCISNAILIGDKRKFLSMFLTFKVTLDETTELPTNQLTKSCIEWCKSVGCEVATVDDILKKSDSKVLTAIQKGIDRVNQQSVSNAARIQRWTILPIDVTAAGGELGPTLKLKRHVFAKKYAEAIETFYK